MASEQAHKIDGAIRKIRAVMEAFDMKGTNRATMLNAINTIEALNTRPAPAATDTGLSAENDRLRTLLRTQSDVHAKHVKDLIAQHERERETYGKAAQDFRERAEKAEKALEEADEALQADAIASAHAAIRAVLGGKPS